MIRKITGRRWLAAVHSDWIEYMALPSPITALWSAANQKLPVIFLIMNNEGYQILKNRLKLFHGNDKPIGMDFKDPPIDTTTLAKGFGVAAERVDTAAGFDAALARSLAKTDGPSLIEVMVKS